MIHNHKDRNPFQKNIEIKWRYYVAMQPNSITCTLKKLPWIVKQSHWNRFSSSARIVHRKYSKVFKQTIGRWDKIPFFGDKQTELVLELVRGTVKLPTYTRWSVWNARKFDYMRSQLLPPLFDCYELKTCFFYS